MMTRLIFRLREQQLTVMTGSAMIGRHCASEQILGELAESRMLTTAKLVDFAHHPHAQAIVDSTGKASSNACMNVLTHIRACCVYLLPS